MERNAREISLSVVVPCYNVEPYLDRSLLCLEQQWNGRRDYEIILVDDASKDKTLEKLKAFRDRFPDNVIVIQKHRNEGVAAARNSALNIAKGKWVVMFDPDDALVFGGYDYLLKKCVSDNIDIISFGVDTIADSIVNFQWERDISSQNFTSLVMSSRKFASEHHIGSSISFLYNRKLLTDHKYPKLTLLEDIVFNVPLFLNDHKVKLVDLSIYYYITRSSSATNTLDRVRLNKGCDDILYAISYIESSKCGESQGIKDTLTIYQRRYARNLFTRLLLSSKNVKQISETRNKLRGLGLFPFCRNEDWSRDKTRLYNYLFNHSFIMTIFRHLYRYYRS